MTSLRSTEEKRPVVKSEIERASQLPLALSHGKSLCLSLSLSDSHIITHTHTHTHTHIHTHTHRHLQTQRPQSQFEINMAGSLVRQEKFRKSQKVLKIMELQNFRIFVGE